MYPVSAVDLIEGNVFLRNGQEIVPAESVPCSIADAKKSTIAHGILAAHTHSTGPSVATDGETFRLRFDALASHDITYVSIIQTAKASGLTAFPLPYILTNCHNSLCAVGGTINEDDHAFGLSAAKKYGGIYVPPHLAVIHSYMREAWAGGGKMILGSDSHTRYGALGTMGVGEGGGELVKQLLSQPYEIACPKVIGVYLEGSPRPWVGPMDVALALIGAVYQNGFAKNAVLEFTGPGIGALSAEYRNGIDVMTTETACWSSIWQTDETIRNYLATHGRIADYRELKPVQNPAENAAGYACYDGMIKINLSSVKPMIALPFHPSNVYELDELLNNPGDIFRQIEKASEEYIGKRVDLGLLEKIDSEGRIHVDQGIIAGCAGGTFDNIMAAADILTYKENPSHTDTALASGFALSVYPGSQPVYLELARNGALAKLAASGAVVKTAFCGPCFGAGDVPANKSLSIRHTTRNFPNREGSRPKDGQIASVALMDARSIAAAAGNGGILCSAETLFTAESKNNVSKNHYTYHFDDSPYKERVYNGIGSPHNDIPLCYGPNITDWPPMEALGEHLLLKIVSFITDPVTTTDELIPSGETSSYRSNPHALAEFTLSRKDPNYVEKAKIVRDKKISEELDAVRDACINILASSAAGFDTKDTHTAPVQIASAIFAVKPGDGSAREQAASCQRVLGGLANFANEYATKRYRSNLINWGLIPFIIEGKPSFNNGDYIFVPGIKRFIQEEKSACKAEAYIFRYGSCTAENCGTFIVAIPELNPVERKLLLAGSLINYNRNRMENNG
ncbi:MAG: hydratase [Treponema sp.]|nr:hydratase [Treponema sp.]